MPIIGDFPAPPTPLTEQVEVVEIKEEGDDLRVTARVRIDPSNPILAGHYPGQPIFPGVCLIECAHHTVLIAAHSLGCTPIMVAVAKARFRDAVLPGDTVGIHAQITRGDTEWTAVTTLNGEHGLAAKVTLRYNVSGDYSMTGTA